MIRLHNRELALAKAADAHQTQVLIVGGGPVGMMLALFLDYFRIRSTVINIEKCVRTHPKGSTHNARTMEHYRRLGISGAIRRLGLPADHPTDAAYFTRLSAWEIARYRMPSERELERSRSTLHPTDQVPEPVQRANQMYVEDFLFRRMKTRSRNSMTAPPPARFSVLCLRSSQKKNGQGVVVQTYSC